MSFYGQFNRESRRTKQFFAPLKLHFPPQTFPSRPVVLVSLVVVVVTVELSPGWLACWMSGVVLRLENTSANTYTPEEQKRTLFVVVSLFIQHFHLLFTLIALLFQYSTTWIISLSLHCTFNKIFIIYIPETFWETPIHCKFLLLLNRNPYHVPTLAHHSPRRVNFDVLFSALLHFSPRQQQRRHGRDMYSSVTFKTQGDFRVSSINNLFDTHWTWLTCIPRLLPASAVSTHSIWLAKLGFIAVQDTALGELQ